MKALSIRQPWAWLIVNGHKDIENRTWPTNFRGRVLIHAGVNYPKRDYLDDVDSLARYGDLPAREEMIGGIVGVATITGCVSESDSEWFNGPYGFVLCDAKPLPLIPCKGALSFFDVPPDAAQCLRELHAAMTHGAKHE
ncbi:ASCH domain-containing protein [Burkholderia sp. Ac-20344]|uniref:ASCH domain-containing protein n=1 Tax=Burkholderia sp. Ac-20344 TaxID=2703890 RepID=UPI00197B8D85|nr:ASCH domain-containing protein [Burkholderia sp. Ac-20344]MBN3832903.1 ASCH domain-containing protein [Burkholderia sp. Ac-20344]